MSEPMFVRYAASGVELFTPQLTPQEEARLTKVMERLSKQLDTVLERRWLKLEREMISAGCVDL